ncbi:hypothetical protein ASF56_20200 [Methylobacterium sp. Leaf122]|nr:hypothetical protein ASF56_20200 [Methylobacterium sp. Leaf122]
MRAVAFDHHALDRHLAIDGRHDDTAVARLQAAIDAGKIPVENPGIAHRVAPDAPEKGGRWVRHEPARQLEGILDEASAGEGKPAHRDGPISGTRTGLISREALVACGRRQVYTCA